MLTEEKTATLVAAVLAALEAVAPDDRLGFLAGVVIGSLRKQGLDWDGVRIELEKVITQTKLHEHAAVGSGGAAVLSVGELAPVDAEAVRLRLLWQQK